MAKRGPRPRQVTVIRYETAEGRRCRKDAPGARRVKTTSDSYYLHLPPREPGGKRERIPLETTDEQVAWAKVRDILAARHLEDLGIADDRTRQAARPIAEHLEEWLAGVAGGGAQADRVKLLRQRVGKLIELAGWRRITDLRKSSCEAALAALRDEAASGVRGTGVGRGRGASAQTRNHYLSHARQFCAWLVADGRLAADPLAGIKRANVAVDRRHDRRCPGELEVRVLFEHLAGGMPHCPPRARRRSCGAQRALAYMVSMCTGLRAGEVRRLTAASFDLDAGEVKVAARSDKARKRGRVLAVPRWLADRLRAWLDGGGPLWGGLKPGDLGEMLQADLARAREGYVQAAALAGDEAERRRRAESTVCAYEVATEDGPTYWDFHALRHWYVTAIAGTDGISPATLQELSRHSDPRLTLETYRHAGRGSAARDAVEQLPRLDGHAG